jgi:preprotein translocase subunit SecA
VDHKVLNAKHHQQEAAIVAQAGRPGAVTIATNMAGRGTDIVLGGNLEAELETLGESPDTALVEQTKENWSKIHQQVLDAGGLHVIGTERHESRRIDNQLRGRSGRQGDPGSSRFYLSLQDSLMRIFASEKVGSLMQKLGMERGEAIEHPWVSRAIENAQRKVEGHNFDIRKHLLEYDDVMNKQREVIYRQRREVLDGEDIQQIIKDMIDDMVEGVAEQFVDTKLPSEDWDWQAISDAMAELFNMKLDWSEKERKDLDHDVLVERLRELVDNGYRQQEIRNGLEQMRQLERMILLQHVDQLWKEHLLNMDHLKEGIGLRGYGQKNPLDEYKKEGFNLFLAMIERVKEQTVSTLMRVQIVQEDELARLEEERRQQREQELEMAKASGAEKGDEKGSEPVKRDGAKVGRNAPCPCGSGKKFKRCCGNVN